MSQQTTPATNYLSSLWTKLEPIPFISHCFGYRILFQRKTKSLVAILSNMNTDLIYKYLFASNSWRKYELQPPKKLNQPNLVLDGAINGDTIYSYTNKHQIAIIKLINETNKYKLQIIKKVDKNQQLEPWGTAIIIADELHYINNGHLKYNINTRECNTLTNKVIPYAAVGLTKVKNKLLLFGGRKDFVREYDIKNNHWKSLPIELFNTMHVRSCTTILNEQMILISLADQHGIFKIYIYEVKTKIIKKSCIKMPYAINRNPCCDIFAINDEKEDILLTYGWIRNEYKDTPVCLQRLIKKYYVKEIVHLFNSNEHYKIDATQILNNYSILYDRNINTILA